MSPHGEGAVFRFAQAPDIPGTFAFATVWDLAKLFLLQEGLGRVNVYPMDAGADFDGVKAIRVDAPRPVWPSPETPARARPRDPAEARLAAMGRPPPRQRRPAGGRGDAPVPTPDAGPELRDPAAVVQDDDSSSVGEEEWPLPACSPLGQEDAQACVEGYGLQGTLLLFVVGNMW